MAQTLADTGPLRGTVELPGDPRIALSALAFGLFFSGSITLRNVPESTDIDSMCAFLADLGASVTRADDTLSVSVPSLPPHIDIDARVPDAVLHQVIAGSVFTADTVTIRGGAGYRERIAGQILRLLAPAGLRSSRMDQKDEDLVIPHAVFEPDGVSEVRNTWELEAILTASCAARRPVQVAYPPPLCAQALKLTAFLGCIGAAVEATGSEDRDLELTRRLARARGARAYQTSVFEWAGISDRPLVLPGDVLVAAALAVCAVMNQRSRLTIRGVAWEQNRRGFFDTLKRMKAPITWSASKRVNTFDTADITVKWGPLEGVQVTAEQSLGMVAELFVLAVAASCANGKTVISADPSAPQVNRDRFRLLAENLERMNAHVGDFSDGIVLHGVLELRGAAVDAGGDEYIALALACCAFIASDKTVLDGIPDTAPQLASFFHAIESVSDLSLPIS